MKDRLITVKNAYTGTAPMIYHETGSPEKRTLRGIPNFLPALVEHVLSLPQQGLGCPEDLTIVTWNNYQDESLLEQTCARLGIPVHVYGKDIHVWTTNYEQKIRLMYEACCKSTTEYILGVDSRDLIFLTSPRTILDEFKKMNIKMLFGGTIKTSGFYKDSPDLLRMFRSLPKSRLSLFRNLNGGQWIASREYAKSFFEKALTYPPRPEKPGSDQIILAHALCYNKELQNETRIDYDCRIFQIYTDAIPLMFFYAHADSALRTMIEKIGARARYAKYAIMRDARVKMARRAVKTLRAAIMKINPARRTGCHALESAPSPEDKK